MRSPLIYIKAVGQENINQATKDFIHDLHDDPETEETYVDKYFGELQKLFIPSAPKAPFILSVPPASKPSEDASQKNNLYPPSLNSPKTSEISPDDNQPKIKKGPEFNQ